uniref:Uncharacterized protein n=1 Tax=viral metagenome TaxID=1070528 RepID=A0A6H1ZD42_9ZZZZ
MKSKITNMILNAEKEPVKEIPESIKEVLEKKVDYDFNDIKKQIERFCTQHTMKNYEITWKFPNLYRISRGSTGPRLVDFKPSYIRYISSDLKQDIQSFFKNTKFLDYFNGNVKLKEVE